MKEDNDFDAKFCFCVSNCFCLKAKQLEATVIPPPMPMTITRFATLIPSRLHDASTRCKRHCSSLPIASCIFCRCLADAHAQLQSSGS